MADKIYPLAAYDADGDRVLSAKRVPGGVRLREECDQYFSVVLTREQLEVMVQELLALADLPEPRP